MPIKAGSANTRSTCFRILLKNMSRDASRFGKWEPVSRDGYTVVCPSLKEAQEMVWFLGGILFPPTANGLPADIDDEAYLQWLLKHHFVIDPHRPAPNTISDGVDRPHMEMSFAFWSRGWKPSLEDFMKPTSSGMREMMSDAFQAKYRDL